MNQNLVSLTLYSPDRGKESVGRNWAGGGGASREQKELTFPPRMNPFWMRKGPAGRKLPAEGNSYCYRGLGTKGVGMGRISKSSFTWPSAIHCLPLAPPDATGSQQVCHKTLAVLSNCYI